MICPGSTPIVGATGLRRPPPAAAQQFAAARPGQSLAAFVDYLAPARRIPLFI